MKLSSTQQFIEKNKISEDKIFELSINAGAKDCVSNNDYHEIITEREDFYKIKSEVEKNVDVFLYSGIEWRPLNYLDITKEQSNDVIKMLETLEEDDDVQNTFVNCNLHTE